MALTIWILLGIAALVLIAGIIMYNRLISLQNRVENGWAQIDVQLKRRNDLIPNLVNTVKGYAEHEKELLENITKARSQLQSAETPKENAAANNQLSNTLKSLFAVAENYPDLKANENFLKLQEELSGTENKIAYARQHYNDVATMYNTKREVFPTNIVASTFNFGEKELFDTPEEEREPVEVSF